MASEDSNDSAFGILGSAAKRVFINRIKRETVSMFDGYDSSDIKKFIVSDYALVEKQLPEDTKETIGKKGSRYERIIRDNVSAESIAGWLKDPEDWLGPNPDDDEVERLKSVGEAIEDTPGGMEWLHTQVVDFYLLAGLHPPKRSQDGSDN